MVQVATACHDGLTSGSAHWTSVTEESCAAARALSALSHCRSWSMMLFMYSCSGCNDCSPQRPALLVLEDGAAHVQLLVVHLSLSDDCGSAVSARHWQGCKFKFLVRQYALTMAASAMAYTANIAECNQALKQTYGGALCTITCPAVGKCPTRHVVSSLQLKQHATAIFARLALPAQSKLTLNYTLAPVYIPVPI
jgi:hypothetical protein